MLKKYPYVKQEGYKDCGCACLSMIIKYYKGNISIEKIRDLTKTSKNGTSAYNLIEGANQIGFRARGVRANIDELKDVILPCIAHVIIDDMYKHYIVIYEININKQEIIIADPDKGIKKISFSKFNDIWTGVLIILYPVRSLPNSKNINISHFLYKNISLYKKELITLLGLSLCIIFLKMLSSFYFKYMIEGIELSKNYLKSIFFIFSFLSIMKLILNYLRSQFLIILNSKLDFSLTVDAFKKIILLPYHYYHNRTTGEIISKINDLGNVRDIISKICVTILIDLPLLIISIIFLARINFSLLRASIIIFILYLILTIIYNKIYANYIGKIKTRKENINSYMYESISGFESIKGINIEDQIIDKFNNKYIKLQNDIYKLQVHMNNQGLFKDFFGDIGNLFILFLGSLLVFNNKMSIGNLITYSSMMVYFLEPIRNIIDMDVDIKETKESINRILSLYERYNDKGVFKFRNGDIEIKNLNYTFDNKKNVLQNINLTIKKGEKIVIYGSSGSGKSTLLKLLMGYYTIDRNMIFIDGIDINDYKIKSLRQNITYISQNEILFNDTILNNLKFCSHCDNNIIHLTKVTEFNEILDNDLGLNMLIEENGFNLSGGQKQRIILARSLLKKSSIILIDEGLNQIDTKLERKILSNIFEKYKDKTIIIISHRKENADMFDRIININNGNLVWIKTIYYLKKKTKKYFYVLSY